MQPIINLLVQLQELTVARAQHEAGMPGAQFDQLDASIAALTKELPDAVSIQFTRLLDKSPLAIVPVVNGACTACGMTLPVSLVHRVKAAEQIYACPSCARLLFHRDSSARNTRKSPRRSDPPKVGIDRFSAGLTKGLWMMPNSFFPLRSSERPLFQHRWKTAWPSRMCAASKAAR